MVKDCSRPLASDFVVTRLLGNCVSLACCVYVFAFASQLQPVYAQSCALFYCVLSGGTLEADKAKLYNASKRFQKSNGPSDYKRTLDAAAPRKGAFNTQHCTKLVQSTMAATNSPIAD